VTTEVEYQLEI